MRFVITNISLPATGFEPPSRLWFLLVNPDRVELQEVPDAGKDPQHVVERSVVERLAFSRTPAVLKSSSIFFCDLRPPFRRKTGEFISKWTSNSFFHLQLVRAFSIRFSPARRTTKFELGRTYDTKQILRGGSHTCCARASALLF